MTNQTKTKYRIRNWKEYNKALIQRGSITLWFCEESIKKWHDSSNEKGGKGRPRSIQMKPFFVHCLFDPSIICP